MLIITYSEERKNQKQIVSEAKTNNNPDDFRPKRIRIKCHKDCFFGIPGDNDRYLPVVFIDDDIRNFCPSLLISTVDKFAQISWNYRYSSLFGKVKQYCAQDAFRPGNDRNCNHNAVRWKDGTRSAFETISSSTWNS